MEGFSFSTEIAVRFAETDAQGIAHNASYLVWFEVARIEYLARFRGGYKSIQADGYEALTIEAHVRYLRPVFFDDRICVHARVVDMRGARFRYEYVLDARRRGRRGRLDAHAVVDRETFRPTRFPAWLAEASPPRSRATPVGVRRRVASRRARPAGSRSARATGFGLGFGFGFVPTRMIDLSPT